MVHDLFQAAEFAAQTARHLGRIPMRNPFLVAAGVIICVASAFMSPGLGQSGEPLPRLGVGAKVSTLGIGIEAATAVTSRSNVRGGINMFNHTRDFSKQGIDYGAQLRLRSVEAHYDWFLGGFHVSPGLLFGNNNRLEGTAGVTGGQSFTLGNNTYISNPADPVSGNAKIDFSKNGVSPMLTAGVGNLLRRSGRRFSMHFEGGVIFQSAPRAVLNLGGSACVSGVCQSVATTPQIQNDIVAEQNKINNGTEPYNVMHKVLRYYPVVSIGFGYRFK
jgi:hypothetical protein